MFSRNTFFYSNIFDLGLIEYLIEYKMANSQIRNHNKEKNQDQMLLVLLEVIAVPFPPLSF